MAETDEWNKYLEERKNGGPEPEPEEPVPIPWKPKQQYNPYDNDGCDWNNADHDFMDAQILWHIETYLEKFRDTEEHEESNEYLLGLRNGEMALAQRVLDKIRYARKKILLKPKPDYMSSQTIRADSPGPLDQSNGVPSDSRPAASDSPSFLFSVSRLLDKDIW